MKTSDAQWAPRAIRMIRRRRYRRRAGRFRKGGGAAEEAAEAGPQAPAPLSEPRFSGRVRTSRALHALSYDLLLRRCLGRRTAAGAPPVPPHPSRPLQRAAGRLPRLRSISSAMSRHVSADNRSSSPFAISAHSRAIDAAAAVPSRRIISRAICVDGVIIAHGGITAEQSAPKEAPAHSPKRRCKPRPMA